jgi:plasmid replication initiation protein
MEGSQTAILFKPKEKNYHSNGIIDSRQEFSMLEKKMIYCIINQIDTNLMLQKDLFKNIYFKIPVSTFGEDYSFKTLKVAINKITTRSITGGDNKKQHAFSIAPIPFAEVKNGVVTLMVQAQAVPLFIDLKLRGYTSYQLDIALSLSSAYSQRLYELLSRFKDTGKWYVEIEKLKFLLGIDKDRYFKGASANGNLKSRVIEPAKKELAEKTDIEFEYSFNKEGRKFSSINFDIFTKKAIQHMKTADAKSDAKEVLSHLSDATPREQGVFLYTSLAQYEFTEAQKKKILDNQTLTLKFIEIHSFIMTGAVEVETTNTRLMAWHLRQLGWS